MNAARGYAGEKKPGFSKLLGISVPTLTRIEAGAVGSIGVTQIDRVQLAERVVKASGCPPEWFDLAPPPETPPELGEAIDALRVQLGDIEDRLGALEAGSSRQARPGRAEDEPPR